jgi:hypothetical protein
MPATTLYGLASSSHVRMSSENFVTSRARCSSNFGQTHAISPFAGSTIANRRSLVPQRVPAK